MALHRQESIPRLKPAVLHPIARLRAAVHRDPEPLDRCVEDQNDQQTDEKIHRCSPGQDHKLLPDRRVAKGPGVGGLLILSLHGTVAADRQGPYAVKCFSFSLFQERRSHADGEFVDLDPKQLCRSEMAELMDRDEQPKHKDG